jgi:hypothetical protein
VSDSNPTMVGILPGLSAVEWARENGEEFRVICRSNAYPDTDRRADSLGTTLYAYVSREGRDAAIITGLDLLSDGNDALHVVDYGNGNLTAYYAAGYSPTDAVDQYTILHTLANAPAGWMLTPRRAYHWRAVPCLNGHVL